MASSSSGLALAHYVFGGLHLVATLAGVGMILLGAQVLADPSITTEGDPVVGAGIMFGMGALFIAVFLVLGALNLAAAGAWRAAASDCSAS